MKSIDWYISQFPESLYQCPKELRPQYIEKCINGYNRMQDSHVLICGVARDVEKTLPLTIARIEKLGRMFGDYDVFIYENDSVDTTKEILLDWSKKDRVRVTCKNLNLSNERSKEQARMERMAYVRNQYLKFIRQNNYCPYVIIVDMDIEGGWSYNGVANSFGWDKWDVIASNGIIYKENSEGRLSRLFFDSWALRMVGHEKEHNPVEANLLAYNRGEEPFKVMSAFGGLAIYKQEVFEHPSCFMYESDDCDHPTLHRQIYNAGYNIYLNPSQIVLYNKHEYCL